MLEVKGKKLRFSRTLWAEYGGVRAKEEQETVNVEGIDEESYVKIFNHFGRVLKLYTFEGGGWIDLETGAAPTALDESRAGRVVPTPVARKGRGTAHAKKGAAAAKPARAAKSAKAAAPAKAAKTRGAKTGGAKTKGAAAKTSVPSKGKAGGRKK